MQTSPLHGSQILRSGIEVAKKHRPSNLQTARPIVAATKEPVMSSMSLLSSAIQQAKLEVESIKPIIQENAAVLVAPSLDEMMLEVEVLEGDISSTTLQQWLNDVSSFANKLRELHTTYQRRLDDVNRKEQVCARRAEDLDKDQAEQKAISINIERRKTELKGLEGQHTERERDLVIREMDARAGFSNQNAIALATLRTEIAELEANRDSLYLELHQSEQKARDEELKRITDINLREAKTAEQERVNALAKRRLDTEWLELENQKAALIQEAKADAELEVRRAVDARQRAEERADRAYKICHDVEAKLDEYCEFEAILAGRSPRQLLDDLSASNRALAALENKLAFNHDDQLQAEKDSLIRVRDEQKLQLDEMNLEMAEVKAQLHRLRLGVTDKESLEKEKRALEKSNQILSTRLNDLGKTVDDLTNAQQADKPFPQLSRMDEEWDKHAEPICKEVPDLKVFAVELRHRIAQAESGVELFYRSVDIQLLLAGLAMSQLHIFQGISGTGKTSLAKAFAKAMGGSCTDIAVQAGWRDRDDLLGHYNAFEKRFYEKDCLQGLYKALTPAYSDRCNIILLDEMNLSRPEQYFAEFLSALEKNDPKDRLISLSENRLPNPPSLLIEGRKVRVPPNLWFVGTANHDETTNEFADKTYDRAHVMTLPRHEESFKIESKQAVAFSYKSLVGRFNEARDKYADEVKELLEDLTTGEVSNVLRKRFELGWGNRFERQAMRFIPVFMAAGGKKEDALDYFMASRVFRRGKVTGRYDATIDDLGAIERAVVDVWKAWRAEPTQCLTLLAEDRLRKERGA